MALQIRIEYAGATYHVMARGKTTVRRFMEMGRIAKSGWRRWGRFVDITFNSSFLTTQLEPGKSFARRSHPDRSATGPDRCRTRSRP